MAKYSLDSISANCYEGTFVLVNKLGIKKEEVLETVEAEITEQRILLWSNEPQNASFDFTHYKTIHKFLFDELYDWAGQIRDVNISKKGTRFCNCLEIEDRAGKVFARLGKLNCLKGLTRVKFTEEFVDFYVSTNDIHPFREGNGRTQRTFMRQLAKNAGYEINLSEIDTDELMIATIHSAQGVTDGLSKIFDRELKPNFMSTLKRHQTTVDNYKQSHAVSQKGKGKNSGLEH